MTIAPKISAAGSGAVFLDPAEDEFSTQAQRRIWAVGLAIGGMEGVRNVVPGMNNLLVTFDALRISPRAVRDRIRELWSSVSSDRIVGKTVEVPVVYGGAELSDWADHCGLPVAEAVRRHASVDYLVAAIGGMPGFPYLAGLDQSLARPRLATPRAAIPEGSVIIGGTQAGIMPQTAPSGWHVIGRTGIRLFDPAGEPPTLLQPGDMVRFIVAGLEP